jgi:AbrB family looped-hinge helix DNA binding protein
MNTTVTLKPNSEILVPKSVRRKAGFKPGDSVEFRVSGRSITIVPKLSPDEVHDSEDIHNPRIQAAIRKSYEQFKAGESRPIEDLFAERTARKTKLTRRLPPA